MFVDKAFFFGGPTLAGTVNWLFLTSCALFAFRVTGSHDRTIRIWSTVTWECEGVIEGHEGAYRTNDLANV